MLGTERPGRGASFRRAISRTEQFKRDTSATRAAPAGCLRPSLAGALLACCAILVAVLGVLFAHQACGDRLDRAVDSQVITWFDGHRGLLPWLAMPGS